MSAIRRPEPAVHYPDSDGEPMADNTVQFDWIAILKWGLEAQYRADPDVFVAGDHLIYPVEGDAATRQAPDVYVAFGRPKGDRGSYKVWEEDNVFPQVVFEVWSPHNRFDQMEDRKAFYLKYGAEEYYVVYPEFPCHAEGHRRVGGAFARVPGMNGFVSPRLGIRFEVGPRRLAVFGADGRLFRRPDEVAADRDAAEEHARREQERADAERERADEATRAADAERAAAAAARDRADKLAARMRELGLDPDAG